MTSRPSGQADVTNKRLPLLYICSIRANNDSSYIRYKKITNELRCYFVTFFKKILHVVYLSIAL